MNILKKILASTIILCVLLQSSISLFAFDGKNLNSQRNDILSSIKWWDKIITKIDSIFERYNSKQLQFINVRAQKIKSEIFWWNDAVLIQAGSKSQDILNILEYILEKYKEKLFIETSKSSDQSVTLSDEDNKKINTAIVKLQKQLLRTGIKQLETLIWEFEKYSSYEEKGDFSMNLDIDHELIWKIEAEFALNDYSVKNSGFDSQITTKMKAVIDALPRWEEALKLEMSWFMDFILKDQNYYLLLKNLNIIDQQWIDDIEVFLEKAKEIGLTNKYIHFEDKNTAEIMWIIKSLSPKNLLSQWEVILSEPMFRAYKKQGDRYYVIPTKYACDTIKQLANKFDPFNGSTCTQWQYENLLEDIKESQVEVYIQMWSDTTIWFEASGIDDEIIQFDWEMTFSDTAIESVQVVITPDQKKFPKEWWKLEYKRNQFLNWFMYADDWEMDMKFSSTLDKNNRFSSMSLEMAVEELFSEISLDNNKISGSYNLSDYNSTVEWEISWKTTSGNKLSSLQITNILKSKQAPEESNISSFEYNNGKFDFTNSLRREGSESDMSFGWTWNTRKKMLTAGHLDINFKEKDSTYDYNTYKRIYNWDFKEVFSTSMKLANTRISGKTSVSDSWKKIIEIVHGWTYREDYFKLNNKFTWVTSLFFLWTDTRDSWNINITIDTLWSNNNINLSVDVSMDNKKALDFEIDNTSKKIYKKVNIIAPREGETIPLEQLIQNPLY